MKTKSIIAAIILFCVSLSSKAQWQLTGNAIFPGNFLGTTNAQPLNLKTTLAQPVNFLTGNTQRAIIDGTTGFMGIGLTAPQNLLHISDGANSVLQITNGATGLTATDGVKVGLLSNSPHAIIANQENARLQFATNGATNAQTRMTILGSGLVGVGTNFIAPTHLLDVDGGDINVNTATNGYMIHSNYVLWHNGNVNDIFVGVGAGNATMSGHNNTFVGNNAGTANSSGTNNTFVGNNAGLVNAVGVNNTFMGHNAGQNNIADDNTFVGNKAGNANNSGTNNTFVGHNAGVLNTAAADNTFMGHNAGQSNLTGDDNTFVGSASGAASNTAIGNTAVGFRALNANTVSGGNVAVGYEALLNANAVYSPLRDGHVAVGYHAMKSEVTGYRNTAIGYEALQSDVDGIQQIAIGYRALANTTGSSTAPSGQQLLGSENTVVGNEAMEANTTGHKNAALGDDNLINNLTGSYNTAIGCEVLGFNISGNSNTGVGHRSLERNTTGDRNTALGDSAGKFNQTGLHNTYSGYMAGFGVINYSQSNNSFYGYQSGVNITTGASNTFMGYQSGLANQDGSRNILIGQQANLGGASLVNAAAIGSEAVVTANNKMILGNDTVFVGIGLSNDVTAVAAGLTFGPKNKLEINTNLNGHDASLGGAAGASGLRLRDLHAHGVNFTGNTVTDNLTVANPFTVPSVLSVDVNGDVILVPDGPGTGPAAMLADNGCSLDGLTSTWVHLGNTLGNTQAQLQDNRQVPMNANSIIFSDGTANPLGTPNPSGNTFNVGPSFNPYPNAASKFFAGTEDFPVAGVFATALPFYPTVHFPASSFHNIGPTGAAGYALQNPAVSSDKNVTGVYGFANNGNVTSNTNFPPPLSPGTVGVRGEAVSTSGATGVMGVALYSGSLQNVGGSFYAGNSALNYPLAASFAGTYNSTTDYVAYLNGPVINVGGAPVTSDSVLKTNITPITNALTTIKQLKPKSFYFDTTNTVGLNLPPKKQYGFLAQNVNTILPELTSTFYALSDSTRSTPYSALNYNGFIGLLTAGMQQQQLSIDSLRANSGGSGVTTCGSIAGGTIPKWTGTNLCNSQLVDDGTFMGVGDNLGGVRFNVVNNDVASRFIAARFGTDIEGNSSNNFGAIASADGSTAENIGIRVAAGGVTVANNNWGIQSSAQGASSGNFAGLFVADQPTTVSGSTSYAVYAQCTGGADYNYALYAKATGSSLAAWSGYFEGNVNVNGGYYQNGSSFTSDQTFKTNIDSFAASNIIKQLKPRSFYFDTTNTYGMNFSSRKQYGLIAQDVQTLLPELVSTFNKPADKDTGGNILHPAKSYKTLNYNAFFAILIKNAQEQQKTIDSLTKKTTKQDSINNAVQQQLAQLTNSINSCCSSGGGARKANVAMQDVELSDAGVVVLNQNQPNPFAEQTTITYNIPQTAGTAQLLFYDVNGKQIQNVNITAKGRGQLNVYANDLTNGVYSYTLIVDGKIVDTKKMIKQQ